jgi:hypothetical protein
MSAAPGHLSIEVLLDYWLGDTDAAATDVVDEHLMRCDDCGAALDGLIALGESVREALRAGALAMVTSAAFVGRLAERGLRVREYRLPHDGSVNCTVAPDDDVLVTRLAAPLQGVQRLDIRTQLSIEPGAQHEQHDVPFDPSAGEVVFVSHLGMLRRQPANTLLVTLLAVDAGGAREVGKYTFNHVPWSDPGARPG